MGRSLAELLAGYKPPTRDVPVCFDLAAVVEYETLRAEHAAAAAADDSISAGDPDGTYTSRLADLEERIRGATETFTVKALSQTEWSDLVARCPDDNPDLVLRLAFDIEKLMTLSIAACTVEPAMTADEAQQLRATLSKPQVEALSNTIWELNNQATSVPFFGDASGKAR